jgi:hypothetical protein
MSTTESQEKARLLKDALRIVDELAKCDFDGRNELVSFEDELGNLVKRAKNLKRNRFWRLT